MNDQQIINHVFNIDHLKLFRRGVRKVSRGRGMFPRDIKMEFNLDKLGLKQRARVPIEGTEVPDG